MYEAPYGGVSLFPSGGLAATAPVTLRLVSRALGVGAEVLTDECHGLFSTEKGVCEVRADALYPVVRRRRDVKRLGPLDELIETEGPSQVGV